MARTEDVQKFFEVVKKTLEIPKDTPPGEFYITPPFEGGQFAVVRVEGEADVDEHVHTYDEFCIVLQGRFIATVGGKQHVVDAPGFIHEPANIPHSARIIGPYVAIDYFAGPRFKVS